MKTMKKVLVVATSRETRGGITAVLKLYEQSDMWQRYHCRWIGTHRDGNDFRKICYYIKGVILFAFLLPFYDIVHFHISLPSTVRRKYPLFIIARLLRKKTVVHLHCGSQIDAIWDYRYQKMFVNCDCGILLSESSKQKVENHIGVCEKLKVVYNPCPIIVGLTSYKKQNHVLFSGTLYEGKGYRDLIKAFSMVAAKYPTWRLVLAGNGEVSTARKLSKELGIETQVELLGWVSGSLKHKSFSEARAFCLPSYAEGFPMAVLDAWAYGLPVISTSVGGLSDIAVDGVNLLLFEPGDVEVLANQLDRVMGEEELRAKLSKESKRLAEQLFDLKTITNQVAVIYSKL